ncbi:winged helix-turn-helix domain-containing protein [Streptomyces sp. Je 1-4]|uniref:winged helix-turn-helix domain-containing protein n=1 Tax=Streptomyces TaxID=1883 RepID=UPI0021D84272|nr:MULTISPECIES: winged helix-turn-helix domain-containing protein [unclassified Streptomyces]UYB42802.1 winged helix-turn-helix domain-containing protein [Streptomyces sp. Je 1-4]UZQ39133.1 winged helix-turn-helix domain-containing protein [Streptomyces sp. Je 1-4] [Streptomyces sp. Je 1-4 4N24]UZQ46550.1 winged helix-turn-helix domain-containing protein [Streptomyces sp. Je 1-4] [Streptomyces sp. Je 1-4 4N24_ara]
MTNLRTLTAGSATAPLPAAPAPHAHRHRLRAVTPDETLPSPATTPDAVAAHRTAASVAELLDSGATWLPAPPHSLPALPGHPPMVGYLVLVPAEQAAATAPQPAAGPEAPATAGDALVRIDPEQRTAQVQDRPLDLTYLEFELLAHLVAHPHRVHTRDQLVTTVWGYGHVGDGRTVDVHVARLRRKLGAEHRSSIVTVRRVGYKYVPSI